MASLLNQCFNEMRQQPAVSAVTVVGTSLAIFLIMVMVMIQQVKVAPFAPESGRDRMLHVGFMSITNKDWGDTGVGDANNTSNGPMSYQTAVECFGNLTTPEAVSIYGSGCQAASVALPNSVTFTADCLGTDEKFWKVFNFTFLNGKPWDKATFDAGIPVAVIDENVARRLFGSTEVSGRELLIDNAPFKVAGVVKPVSTLARKAYAQVWTSLKAGNIINNTWCSYMGGCSATILARDRADFPEIRAEVERLGKDFNRTIGEAGWRLIYRNRPYDQEKEAIAFSANLEPDVEQARHRRWMTYLILLLVPAVNLSSMTHSRLRQRVSEIAIRRAFGATRMRTIFNIVTENLIVTLIAGVIGLLLSVVVAFFFNDMLFSLEYSFTLVKPKVDLGMLIQWSTFGLALGFCFVLNLLSSGIPAIQAARIGLVNALRGSQK